MLGAPSSSGENAMDIDGGIDNGSSGYERELESGLEADDEPISREDFQQLVKPT